MVEHAYAVSEVGGFSQPAPSSGFLLRRRADACRYCWSCARRCPARAIRVVDGHAEIIEERCVKCGICVSECANECFIVRDDVPKVLELLSSGRQVVAVLATEYTAALHPRTPEEVELALRSAGFYSVESTLLGEELVAIEYERNHSRQWMALSLRSTCPVAVDWVRMFYPELVSTLAPIVPPYIAQARLVKATYSEDTAVVYVSPCYARKDEIVDPQFAGAVDAAIDFLELDRILTKTALKPAPGWVTRKSSKSLVPRKEISLTDGFPRRTLKERGCTDGSIVTVRGLRQLDRLLAAIVRGEAAPSVVDMLNCEGCIDGPTVHPGLSLFAKRNIVSAEREATPAPRVGTRELLGHLPAVDLVRSFTPRPVREEPLTAEQIDAELARGEFMSRDEALDCGACGYTTCVEHATAVLRGNSTWEACLPLHKKRHARVREELERAATIDSLTGLWNRHAFDQRLAEETSRALRYSTPLSLLMIDVDGFKLINDTYGHPMGDWVLQAFADILRSVVREADVAVRYGGDEFALVLPFTDKTRAFAVAEKLRAATSVMQVQSDGGEPAGLEVTISIGVAALRPDGGTAKELLESADRALYQAKRSGKNQVRIAAG